MLNSPLTNHDENSLFSKAMIETAQIFTFLFLMLGPFKIIGPFAKMTEHASPELIRQLSLRAIFYSILAILAASFLGEMILTKYGIPLPVLAMTAGLILFLVALSGVIRQYKPAPTHVQQEELTLSMAFRPLAFPTIVTPYGVAAVIVFMAISPDLHTKLIIGAIVTGIMLLNLAVMLLTRHMGKLLFVVLSILGAVLGVVQVALGLMIVINQLKVIFHLS